MKKKVKLAAIPQNTDLTVENRFNYLKDVRIGIVGGGGIAAIELPRLARELRRYGAIVSFFVTENCLRFIGREALEWSSANLVTVTPTGFAEHICQDELVIVLPGTANILASLAHGICTDGASTYLQSAVGQRKTILVCQTMHSSLSESIFVKENIEKVSREEFINFIPPRLEEGKLKAPNPTQITKIAAHVFNKKNLTVKKSKKVLLTVGGSRVMIDAVRCLGNLSSGRLGSELVYSLYCSGFEVDVICGNTDTPLEALPNLNITKLPEYSEFYSFLKSLDTKKYSALFHTAALSDYFYSGETAKKISSQLENLTIKLKRAPKAIQLPSLRTIPFKIACKLTTTSEKEGIEIAKKFMRQYNLNAVLWNSAETSFDKQTQNHKGVLILSYKNKIVLHSVLGKKDIAIKMAQEFKKWFTGE